MYTRTRARTVFRAWIPYLLLVVIVLLIGYDPIKNYLNQWVTVVQWPGLHNLVMRSAPAVETAGPYPAVWTLNLLTASGTATMLACILAAIVASDVRRSLYALRGLRCQTTGIATGLDCIGSWSRVPDELLRSYRNAWSRIRNHGRRCFRTSAPCSDGLASSLLGRDTSANALFGNLQVVTAGRLELNPLLMAASNSSGGVMGKMISLQSIAVAAAAAGMPSSDESRLFRFTLKHSILLASILGLIVMFYAYVSADLGPVASVHVISPSLRSTGMGLFSPELS